MFRADPVKKRGNYYSVKDATFRLPTNKEDPEAIRRDYTNPKTSQDGVAYERGFKALYGQITDVSFHENTLADGTVLRSINIALGEDESGILQIVSLPIDSRYTTEFLKRLPKIDFSKEVRLMPYDIDDGKGPRQVGIAVHHLNTETGKFTEKVPNDFFTQAIGEGSEKKYTNLHGFPEATEEDASDWPFYFKKVSKFLIKYAQDNVIPKIRGNGAITQENAAMNHIDPLDEVFPTKDEINPDDIPF